QFLALQVAQRVLQLHRLNEQVVLRVESRHRHRRLEVETQPLLNSDTPQLRRTLCQIEEQDQVEHDRRCQNRVTAEEIDFNLHGVAEPAEDVDVVPTLFVITARRVVVNADLVGEFPVQLGIEVRLQDVLQNRQL